MMFICCLIFPTRRMLQDMCWLECLVCAQQRVASEVIQVGIWHLMGDVLLHRRRMCHEGKWKAASNTCGWEENQSDGWEKWAWQDPYDLVQTRKCCFSKLESSGFLWLPQIGIWMKGKEGFNVPPGLLLGKKNIKSSCNPGVNRGSSIRDDAHVTSPWWWWWWWGTQGYWWIEMEGLEYAGDEEFQFIHIQPELAAWHESSQRDIKILPVPSYSAWNLYRLYFRVRNTYSHVCEQRLQCRVLFASPNLLHTSQFIKAQFPFRLLKQTLIFLIFSWKEFIPNFIKFIFKKLWVKSF